MNPAALAALLNGDVANLMVAATPGGIEKQEAAGQAKLAKEADRLPLAMNYPSNVTRSQVTEALGITFGKVVDTAFIEATLPDGWAIKPTNHSMWSDLLDEKGRKRASIFFKAAFYDYDAHMSFECRYRVNLYYEQAVEGVLMYRCQVVDSATETVLWSSDFALKKDYNKQDRNFDEAKKWLSANFPKYEDLFAYWND